MFFFNKKNIKQMETNIFLIYFKNKITRFDVVWVYIICQKFGVNKKKIISILTNKLIL